MSQLTVFFFCVASQRPILSSVVKRAISRDEAANQKVVNTEYLQLCVGARLVLIYLPVDFLLQMLTSASMTLATMANASTPMALSGVNVPWDTGWTTAMSRAKASSARVLLSQPLLNEIVLIRSAPAGM